MKSIWKKSLLPHFSERNIQNGHTYWTHVRCITNMVFTIFGSKCNSAQDWHMVLESESCFVQMPKQFWHWIRETEKIPWTRLNPRPGTPGFAVPGRHAVFLLPTSRIHMTVALLFNFLNLGRQGQFGLYGHYKTYLEARKLKIKGHFQFC